MAKIMPILTIVTRVLLGLVLVSALVLNLGMAYIMFMPDSLPKPFYLLYSNAAGGSPTVVQQAPTGESLEPGVAESNAEIPVEEEPVAPVPGEGIMLNTGTKIVNLADTTKSRYIRVTIVMEFAMPEVTEEAATAAEGEEEVTAEDAFTEELNKVLPLIDDTIITTLSTKAFEDLYTADGKETLRTEIMDQVIAKLPHYELIAVYFTEFVVE
jgi:flagellar FliL protein